MRAEYINPFVRAIVNTFETMLACPLERGAITLKNGDAPMHEISGVIGLSGKAVGTVVVSLSHDVALKAASAMLMIDATQINDDVIDAVGEIANMVAGAAKAELEEYAMSVSLPNVITGKGHEVRFPSTVTPICVPFSAPWGELTLEVGLALKTEPAGV